MHVAEQQAEVDACIAEHGMRPVELLDEVGALDERFCAVHATCITAGEATRLGTTGASVCICPTTERDLGDGLADLATLRNAGVRLCVGVDSHVVTDHIEEMRALETHERLRQRRRVTFEPADGRTLAEQLLAEGSANGAASIGFEAEVSGRATRYAPSTVVPLGGQAALVGVGESELLDAVIFSGSGLRFERDLAYRSPSMRAPGG
jgi:cytosine/adenosine deaminase-related metal-dependent hydrolase